jgi:TrmH family RNA methyltransferase
LNCLDLLIILQRNFAHKSVHSVSTSKKIIALKKDIKWVRSLQQKKFRNESGCFGVEGRKGVEEGLQSFFKLHSLYTTDADWAATNKQAIAVSAKEMEQMSGLATPSAHLAVFHQHEQTPDWNNASTVLVLDGIADPGNMGTIIRTAEWFGINTILCTQDCVELYNPKVVQATMGSVFRMCVTAVSDDALQQLLKSNDYYVVAADLKGTNIYTFDFNQKTAIIIGSESHGVRPAMRSLVQEFVTIPGSGRAESLNASVAATVFMSQWHMRGKA